jgi:hypothetical protein
MSCFRRNRCACKHELIHRDHRAPHESSSAFGTIIRRTGPAAIVVGDIDCYIWRWDIRLLRIIEHKQENSPEKKGQMIVLKLIDRCIKIAARTCVLARGSGVYIVRGEIEGIETGRKQVVFKGPQRVTTVHGAFVTEAATDVELWNWLWGDSKPWAPYSAHTPDHFVQAEPLFKRDDE